MRKFIFHIVLLVSVFSASAQKDTSRPHLSDDKYQPKFNKALMYDTDKSIDYSTSRRSKLTKVVKFNPTLLPRKTLAIGFEKQFPDLAFELFVGYNFGMDKALQRGFDIANDDISSLVSRVDLNSMMRSATTEYGGLFLGGSARFMWNGDYFDGYYMGLSVRRSQFGFAIDPDRLESITSYAWKPGGNTQVSVTNNTFHFIQGVQRNTGGKVAIVSEFYVGVGLRVTRVTEIKLQEIYNSANYTTTRTMVPSSGTNVQTGLSFIAGYIIGFGF